MIEKISMDSSLDENKGKKRFIIILLGVGVAIAALLIWIFFFQGEAAGL